jgi:hypothetical protein
MSYLPSDNGSSVNAMIVDVNSSGSVSSDITSHTDGTFLSTRYTYFIDVRHNITLGDPVSGLNFWRHWSTGTKFGGTFRGNAPSGLTMMTDESYCGANIVNSNMSLTSSSSGGASVVSDISFKAIWRIT